MTVPQENVRFFCNVRRIRSSVPLRPTFEDDETWYCGTAIAVPYVELHKVLGVTGYYKFHCKMKFFDSLMRAAFGPPAFLPGLQSPRHRGTV